MASILVQDIYIPKDGQKIIYLSRPYNPGSIRVLVNGDEAIVDEEYREAKESIEFLYELNSMDYVVVEQEIEFRRPNPRVIGDAFKKTGDENRLMPNQRYDVKLSYQDQEFSYSFWTELSPLFTSVPIIRGDLGSVIDGIADSAIQFQIYQNSVLATQIAETPINPEEELPLYVKQYVRYRTELDLLNAMFFAIAGKSGSDKKILGQMEVTRYYKVEDVSKLIADIQNKLRGPETELRGLRMVAGAVRGGNNAAYPLTSPRRDFTDGSA